MRQVRIGASYGVNNLYIDENNIPTPGPGEVLIKVKAASLNYRDWEIVNGLYHTNYSEGVVPLSDGTGQVMDVGPEVTRFQNGDRVVASFWQGWNSGELGQSPAAKTVGGPGGWPVK